MPTLNKVSCVLYLVSCILRANYQAKIWLQADHDIEIMDLENKLTETIDLLQEGKD